MRRAEERSPFGGYVVYNPTTSAVVGLCLLDPVYPEGTVRISLLFPEHYQKFMNDVGKAIFSHFVPALMLCDQKKVFARTDLTLNGAPLNSIQFAHGCHDLEGFVFAKNFGMRPVDKGVFGFEMTAGIKSHLDDKVLFDKVSASLLCSYSESFFNSNLLYKLRLRMNGDDDVRHYSTVIVSERSRRFKFVWAIDARELINRLQAPTC